MFKRSKRGHGHQTFRTILSEVAPENASKLMGRARTANKLAKSFHGRSRARAYAVKSGALLRLATTFPDQVRIVIDLNTPRFVVVQAPAARFGLHVPSRILGGARIPGWRP
jgi:hypothetical protein